MNKYLFGNGWAKLLVGFAVFVLVLGVSVDRNKRLEGQQAVSENLVVEEVVAVEGVTLPEVEVPQPGTFVCEEVAAPGEG